MSNELDRTPISQVGYKTTISDKKYLYLNFSSQVLSVWFVAIDWIISKPAHKLRCQLNPTKYQNTQTILLIKTKNNCILIPPLKTKKGKMGANVLLDGELLIIIP